MNRRVTKEGVTEYLLKWKGYTTPSWEISDNVLCTDLIKEFEDSQPPKTPRKKATTPVKRKGTPGSKGKADGRGKRKKQDINTYPSSDHDLKVGFEHGDEVQDIIGARMEDELFLYVSWNRKPDYPMSFIPARVANEKIPQKVIAFYESRLKFDQHLKE